MKNKDRLANAPKLKEGESALRSMMAEASGEPYVALPSLAEARADPEGVVIFEGDDGGQIYAVVPARLVKCDEPVLHRLLAELDAVSWRQPDMAHLYFERLPVGSGVSGGMGGGLVTQGVWVHPRLQHLESQVAEVLAGARASILQ